MPVPIDGESLMPVISGGSPGRMTGEVYSEVYYHLTAMFQGHHKLIHDSETGQFELYDVEADYAEAIDLAATDPATRHEMAAVLSE